MFSFSLSPGLSLVSRKLYCISESQPSILHQTATKYIHTRYHFAKLTTDRIYSVESVGSVLYCFCWCTLYDVSISCGRSSQPCYVLTFIAVAVSERDVISSAPSFTVV